MRLSLVGIALLLAAVIVLSSCGDDEETFTPQRRLEKIALLNSSLTPCGDLSVADSVRVCAAAMSRQILQQEEVSAATRRIWEKYAQANALTKRYGHEAIVLIDKTLPETEDYEFLFERAQFLTLRSYINTHVFNRQLAVYDAYQAADIYMELGLSSAAAVCYLNIANVQYNAGNQQLAIENALQTVSLYRKSSGLSHGDSLRWMNACNTLGMSFSYLGDYTAAVEQFRNGLSLAGKMRHELWAGLITGGMAKIDISKGDYDEAWMKYNENIRVGLKFNELASAGYALMGQAEILMKRRNMDAAKQYYDSAWQMMRKEQRPDIWFLYFRNIAAWYEAVNEYDSANANYKRYIAVRDSTQGVQSSQLLRLQNQIQFEKQLSLLRVENNLKKNELKTSYVIIIAFVAILVLLSLLLYSLRRNYKGINMLNDELEHKVNERTNELLRLNKELDTYLYRASHDVRRPILSIIGLGRLVSLARDDNERREIQQKIDITAHDMDRMLSKLRMAYVVDKLEDVQDVTISAYFSSLLAKFGDSHPGVIFDLTVSDPVTIHTSVSLLDVIFVNILENACTFRNPVNPRVAVNVITADNHLHIAIKDNGIGIDSKYLKTMFDPYTRYSYHSTGSGLGLHLAQKAVNKLKGTITVESTLYIGSEFRVKIPLKNLVSGALPA